MTDTPDIDPALLLPILIAPHPVLKAKARAVATADADLMRGLIPRMFATMYKAPGIGLAAPQIGQSVRMFVMDVKDGETNRPMVMVNPEIIASSPDLNVYEEGCLSLPQQFAEVTRPRIVRVRFENAQGMKEEIEADGLMLALEEYAATSSRLYQVDCRFECDSPVLIHDPATAGHLYRIAQEAVGNAIKHGRAKHILIRMEVSEEGVLLQVKDDGVGLPEPLPKTRGMGLRIMAHRSAMIHGSFQVRREPGGGTLVACEWRA